MDMDWIWNYIPVENGLLNGFDYDFDPSGPSACRGSFGGALPNLGGYTPNMKFFVFDLGGTPPN